MNIDKKRSRILVILLLIAITLSGIVTANAGTKAYFNLKGTESVKTSTFTTGTNKFKYVLHWNNVSTDNVPTNSYYLNVKLQKRNIGVVYVTKSNINYYGPVSGSHLTCDFDTQLQNITARYILENYGALSMSGYIESNSYN